MGRDGQYAGGRTIYVLGEPLGWLTPDNRALCKSGDSQAVGWAVLRAATRVVVEVRHPQLSGVSNPALSLHTDPVDWLRSPRRTETPDTGAGAGRR